MPTSQPDVVEMLRKELGRLGTLDASEARTMPPVFYTSEAFLELEKEEIFHKEWICLGHAGEIPNPGDFYTTELVGEQLIVTRDKAGEVHVLSNVCRHRGNIVAQGRGNRRSFVCQYHAWTYDIDGALKTAPLMNKIKGFDRKKRGLPQFRTEIWNNFIFVNLDGQAKPLAPRLKGLDKILHNYHHEARFLVFHEDTEWTTNWKNLNENFMEGYHLASTHPKTLQPMTPTSGCVKVPGEEGWTAYRSYYDPNYPPRGPFHKDLTEDERKNTILFNVFPSFVCAIATNFTLFLCLRPAGADKVGIRWGVAGLKDEPDSGEVKAYVDLCNAFNAEDREKLETLQIAQNTRYYRSGPLAPADYEGTIWDFLNFMARKLAHDTDPA